MSARNSVSHSLYLGFVALVYIFLLTPLVIVVMASFNAGEFLTFPPQGFSLKWYVSFFDSEAFMDSLLYSLKVAALCTVFSTLLGTSVALYVVRFAGRWREQIRLFILMPLLLPEILTAIALLFFYYNFDALMRSLGLPDAYPFMFLLGATVIVAFVIHRAARATSVRQRYPDWESWTRKEFPMGFALAPALLFYLLIGLVA